MFRRLHGEDEYGGRIGAGLSIVKAIIEQHDGAIWIADNEGETGTKMMFSIPIEP